MFSGPGLDSGDTTTGFGAPNARGSNDDPATDTFAIGTMLTRRSSSAFDLLDHLVQHRAVGYRASPQLKITPSGC